MSISSMGIMRNMVTDGMHVATLITYRPQVELASVEKNASVKERARN